MRGPSGHICQMRKSPQFGQSCGRQLAAFCTGTRGSFVRVHRARSGQDANDVFPQRVKRVQAQRRPMMIRARTVTRLALFRVLAAVPVIRFRTDSPQVAKPPPLHVVQGRASPVRSPLLYIFPHATGPWPSDCVASSGSWHHDRGW